MIKALFLLIVVTSLMAGMKITVYPGDSLNDSLSTLSTGDSLYLTPGLYTSSVAEPLLFCDQSQSGVTILSDPLNRAVLDGENLERSIIVLAGPFTDPVNLENLVITGGNASGSEAFTGGGIYCNECDLLLSNSLVTGNSALIGGGLGAEGSSISLNYCTFSGNQSFVSGGGVNLYASYLTGFMLRFLNNTSSDDGGGLNSYQSETLISNALFADNYSGDDGGGLTILQGTADLEYLTMTGNEAFDDGGAIRMHTIDSLNLRSSIIASNYGKYGVNVLGVVEPSVSYTCCWGNEQGNYNGIEDPAGTLGNISEDPLFADSEFNLSQQAAGQQWDSPSLDAGHELCWDSSVSQLSTRTDSIPDADTADMGFHHLNNNQAGTEESEFILPGTITISPSPASLNASFCIYGVSGSSVNLSFHDLAGRQLGSVSVPLTDQMSAPFWLPSVPGFESGIILVRADWESGSGSGKVMVVK